MIVDNIRNRALYYGLGENFKAALDWLAAYPGGKTEREDIEIDGDRLFVRIRPGMTRPIEDCKIESHDEYADIHFVPAGAERIGYADTAKLQRVSYDAAKDAALLTGDVDLITLRAGDFMITLKDDAHMPCVAVGEPAPLEKLIVKVKL